ncbi:hypothetical protein [Myxococcus sp. AS-1-15]|uniref:hypothetical protein n=1 Tax=Myxococcus sp. AS-1-15 TaxID=2874600 RepID=UPI001CBAE9A1|nr:hypothetical protein [Myxococcus sp. AS-1-15]MBZ4401943.1 hypothetical protein [Myxococcus sp. AS-1-15]
MSLLKKEIEGNFTDFSKRSRSRLSNVTASLDGEVDKYLESYARLVSLQAWRSELLERLVSEEALGFFFEAQNDAIVSHVLARQGCWRSSLKSLRSCIENVMQCLYYKDHPVELELWQVGDHRLGRAALQQYLEGHPRIREIKPDKLTGLGVIAKEYGTLSRAVHASAKGFRMTADADAVQLCSDDRTSLGKWLAREKSVLMGINLLLTVVYREELGAGRVPNLRQAVGLAIPQSYYSELKSVCGVSLVSP